MIDKTKNVCYVIHLYYRRNHEVHKHKFLSRHQITSKCFEQFADDYFRNVFPVSKSKRGDGDGHIGDQWTVRRKMWPDVKDEVLEGITEKEKCY